MGERVMKKQAVKILIAEAVDKAIAEYEAKNNINHVKVLLEALRGYGIRVDVQEPYDPSRGGEGL